MTEPERKPRWTPEQRREARSARGGKEQRANYRNAREDRQFRVGVSTAPSVRASGAGSNSTAATISGSPIVYDQPYTVFDRFGSFTEVVQAGALTSILPTSDTRFLYNHDGLVLARTASGTLVLTDTPKALNCTATLDPRMTVAADLVLAIGRGDVDQMSVGFIVADDIWDADFSHRTITLFQELMDVSAVCFPASPTTSVELLDVPEHLLPAVGGDDGTQGGGSGNAPGIGNDDGTGSRAALARLRVDRDRLDIEEQMVAGIARRHGLQLRSAAKYTQSQIDAMGKKGQAFGPDKDGHYSYPIADHADVKSAVKAVGRGKADHDKIRKYIIKRADAIGASHLIPDNWNSDGSLKQSNSAVVDAIARRYASTRK